MKQFLTFLVLAPVAVIAAVAMVAAIWALGIPLSAAFLVFIAASALRA